ncbi:SDR family NAD(P)-dependent oxidoreductase [Halalkalibacter sp. APA_J-10(15)]|uniref:SDR family NAD(P)-dependent oxidoreductase n=1 Tax=Halalkalibacter sp. APA_J-10(15) TaxID=2933805 RepID=UPI001FF54D5B|nr:SDR family NAD(P)-dependent oxidoreductase [Halalkalibacter sp. APA_J-10(15)]MCK0470521.1 polysaccharide biosynthesis protein [Halalkalibacter sp. APA_J-10(15)]
MYFTNKKILIIGGTGTIGQSLIKQILLDNPTVVRVFSRDEYKQYHMNNLYGNRNNIRFCIGDVRDYDRVFSAMEDIDYVFHLAAMKHVPSCEYNPFEAVQTNVLGTNNVIKAAIAHDVKKVIFTSSDKAISPTNTYGATKLTAERLISAAEYSKGKGKTIFASVRFGNVMGSRGSVIPFFKKQLIENKKMTVTDRNMTRFMMTLSQATNLTIQALKEARGGEVFVLKMPVLVLDDLVDVIINETCKKNQLKKEEITVEYIGLRTGEKLYEELMTYDESLIAWELLEMFVIPGHKQTNTAYENAKRAKPGTYRSSKEISIDKKEIRHLLINENLI